MATAISRSMTFPARSSGVPRPATLVQRVFDAEHDPARVIARLHESFVTAG